ncbi:segregation/condensation protein A [Ruminococcus sp. Marseille-P6503]|uniref:segregation and condensation protein A n=1 Tax=Ruminococcus sp. Marseille-P6503 TaxID=2364796 RepID=UPI000F54A2AD|nr:segregation/condensation protein A [Ruminococcus sp. Marseille-P6503]
MSSISFKLEAFEGPLDLLLHLISKHKLNIYDIEISLLLDQYMEYISCLETDDYESAADFLEMAARLIYIKTCSLLPQPEEAKELKKELEGRIIEYSLCKTAAERLKELYAGGDIFVRQQLKLPVNKAYTRTHDVSVLYDAYMGISSKAKQYKPLRANVFSPIVSHRIVSVTSKIIFVLKKLYKTGECEMSRLYSGITDKSEKVATFLAVLELTKSGRIYINDDNTVIRFSRTNKKHTAFAAETGSESASQVTSDSGESDEEKTSGSLYSHDSGLADEAIYEPPNAEKSDVHRPEKEVKFSSERMSKTHTISLRGDIRAIAASAPVIEEYGYAKGFEAKASDKPEQNSCAVDDEPEALESGSAGAVVKQELKIKLNWWRYGNLRGSFFGRYGKNNLWRYRFL